MRSFRHHVYSQNQNIYTVSAQKKIETPRGARTTQTKCVRTDTGSMGSRRCTRDVGNNSRVMTSHTRALARNIYGSDKVAIK